MEIIFPQLEKKILKFWKESKVFEKSIEKRKKAPTFVFYEGPPTANARPGLHHVLARVFKDLICRYKTMRGFRVERKAGWDTHGLPVELEIEKKLGLKNKKEIEKYGIAPFNRKCRQSVWVYKADWEKLTERIGFWLDMENPYITYTPEYIETVWWILKQIWQKGLLYRDYKVSPYCPRCQTVLSSHEVAQGYEKIRESAIYVKFLILDPKFENTSLLVWTTTPWTLPANVAIAINKNFVYVKVKINGENLILAKERIKASGIKGEIVKEFKGKHLIGLKYQPPYPSNSEVIKKAYRVIAADFVFLKEGTGLVHIAPAFGEEDLEIGKKNNLPILLTVDEEGKFKLEVKKWAGIFVKEADSLIIEDLKNQNLLFKEETYEHNYPFCWRCHSSLLYYAKKSWFIRMTKMKKELIKNNQKINWIPAHLKEGRFGEWLREVKDWALSRERYWGTPLPIWQCPNCDHLEVIGSKKDLLSQKFSTNQYFLLRHGQTIYQTKKKKEIYPSPEDTPVGLTKEGIKKIQKLAKKLKKEKIDLIYSSDFYRTKQTAQIVAEELNLKINFDSRLREFNFGSYHGKPKKEFYREFPTSVERFEKKLPGGESWFHCQKRITGFLKEVEKKNQNKRILIVSHGDPIWLLVGAVKGKTKKELIEEKKKGGMIKTGEVRGLEFKSLLLNGRKELDFHRPYIDEVKFYCPKCQNLMERTPEVIDCWFDSGSMPFAQYHYPFENKKLIDKKIQFSADYISEGIDQTRGWFYTLLAISTLLEKGPAYKNVISLGHVLDENGEKMSKSKGNVVDPWQVVEKYGADATRWYFYSINQPGDSKLFSEKDVEKVLKKFVLTFWNCFLFFTTYTNIPYFLRSWKIGYKAKNLDLLDKWVISKLNQLILDVTNSLERYDVTLAARGIESFMINDLSLWYIRRSRKRFEEAFPTLVFVLETLTKLTAPFIPFLSEEIYQRVSEEIYRRIKVKPLYFIQSVHSADWPKADKKLINKKLERKMEKVREIVTKALAERAKVKIKVRQPLRLLKIRDSKSEIQKEEELLDLIREEVNVKEITFDPKTEKEVELDTEITPELKEEGIIREVIRHLQEMRKIAGFKPQDEILVNYSASEELNKILERNKSFILKEGKIENLVPKGEEKLVFATEREVMIEQQKLWLGIKKV